jgi:hypothetical protein
MATRSSFHGFHVHVPEGLLSVLVFLLPFAALIALAVVAAQLIPWN